MFSSRSVILVIDDEPEDIQAVGSLLSREGYEVVAARSGERGIAIARESPPDLILLDVAMPGMSGVEVARRLQEDPEWPQTPIIILSTATDTNLVIEALAAGAVDYVTKPLHGRELLRRIEMHLGLRRANRLLEEAVSEKNRLIEVLAHDLKNPLGSVRFSAKLLEEQKAGDTVDRLAGMILEASDRAIEIVQSLLQIRWMEHAKTSLVLEPLSLNELVSDVHKGFADQANEKGITVQVRHTTPVTARADRGGLLRVLENLVSNSLKFSPSGSTVTLSLSLQGPAACFLIEDEGPGIPAAEVGQLFQRYARLSSRPTAGEASTGLGLSIVKELVEAMGGAVSFRPSATGGAGFQVLLPTA